MNRVDPNIRPHSVRARPAVVGIQVDHGQLHGGEVDDQAAVVQIASNPASRGQPPMKVDQVGEHSKKLL
jgi:hypothetical protein